MKKKIHIGVFMGGSSSEREISLLSGTEVSKALSGLGYRVTIIDPASDGLLKIKELSIDVAFIALHGKFGEDGTIQGFLETLNIPYTGSGVLASALAMNKYKSKKIFLQEGIPTPKFEIVKDTKVTLDLPVVVKPVSEGSSIGVSQVFKEDALDYAIRKVREFGTEVLVEELIQGTEITQAIIDGAILPTIQINTDNDFYDYDAKYRKDGSIHIIPPQLPAEWIKSVQDASLMAYNALGCEGVARVDTMVDKQGNPFVLEVNTIPGMTALSLVPDAAKAAGMKFEELCEKIVDLALKTKR